MLTLVAAAFTVGLVEEACAVVPVMAVLSIVIDTLR